MQSSIPPSDYPALAQRSTHAKSASFNSCRVKGARGQQARSDDGPVNVNHRVALRQVGHRAPARATVAIPCNARSIPLEQTWELPLSSAAAVKAGIWEIQWLENSAAAGIGPRLPRQ